MQSLDTLHYHTGKLEISCYLLLNKKKILTHVGQLHHEKLINKNIFIKIHINTQNALNDTQSKNLYRNLWK